MKKLIPVIMLLFASYSYGQVMDSISYDFGHIYFHSYGVGDDILVLSGGPGNDVMSLETVALNLSKNNRIILLEQRGTGRSLPTIFDKTTLSIESAIDDINSVLDRLEIDKVILLGHSYGANLATIFASKFPEKVKSMILVSPGVFDYNSGFISLCNISSRLGSDEVIRWEELLNKSYTKNFSQSEKDEFAYLNRLAYIYDKTKIKEYLPLINGHLNEQSFGILSMDMNKYDFKIIEGLENISVPINIVCGRQDIFSFMTYEYKIAKPSVNLHWIDQSGHFPMFETPNEFYSIIEKILD